MSFAGSGSKSYSLTLRNAYATQFRNHALTLLWLGYQRLTPANFAIAEEDDITGELKREIDNVLEDSNSPKWVEHYSVAEQVRTNVMGLRGKRRSLIDIEIERSKHGKRPRLPFEAKRLRRGSNVGDYLGGEGLGAFLDGTYPTTHGEAGMLGYIQEGTEHDWANKLSSKIAISPKQYKITSQGSWSVYSFAQHPLNTYYTAHYNKQKNQIEVIHVLLLFH